MENLITLTVTQTKDGFNVVLNKDRAKSELNTCPKNNTTLLWPSLKHSWTINAKIDF